MKRVLITGGTGTLGQALIEVFAKTKKFKIEFTYYRNSLLAKNLSKKYKIKAIRFKDIDNLSKNYDIVINNAGIVNAFVETEKVKLKDWDDAIKTNLTLPFLIIKKVLPYMKSKKYGRIVNISSVYAIEPEEELLPYNVSKVGLLGLTKTVAKEYSKKGITCNAICPNAMESEMVDRVAGIYSKNKKEKEKLLKEWAKAMPGKKLIDPRKIAKKVLSVIGNGSINGKVILVN